MKIVNCKLKNSGRSGQNGYLALISAIIISGVLMTVVFTLSFKSFNTRINLLESEYKKRSLNIAEACANHAILEKIKNSSYNGNQNNFPINDGFCNILAFEVSGSDLIVKTTSTVGKTVSNIQVNLNSATFAVNRWREVTNF